MVSGSIRKAVIKNKKSEKKLKLNNTHSNKEFHLDIPDTIPMSLLVQELIETEKLKEMREQLDTKPTATTNLTYPSTFMSNESELSNQVSCFVFFWFFGFFFLIFAVCLVLCVVHVRVYRCM